jgi:imidazolonepropionase-like amidohydrolase
VKKILYTILLLCLALEASLTQEQSSGIAIRAKRLIDGTGKPPIENPVILIEGNKIISVGSKTLISANATVIDLGDATILPGLIDCHTHLTWQAGNYWEDKFKRTPIDRAIEAPLYAKKTLLAGFTTCRDVGSNEYVDVSLRNAIAKEIIEGPRLFVATHSLTATGGHGDNGGVSPYIEFHTKNGVVDGAEEAVKKVRENFKYGADLIKIHATAGVLSEEETVGAQQFSLEEMKSIVDEAARHGKKVAAHAHGTEGIKAAIRAGVASIEHSSMLDDEALKMMKERGTYYVPTLYVGEMLINDGAKLQLPEKLLNKAKYIVPKMRESFRKAFQAGINIAFGTDAGVFPHGDNAKEFSIMVKEGMTPLQAIVCATSSAAKLIGIEKVTGTIEAGKFADIIAVRGNPLDTISVLENVSFVMKEGKIVKNNLSKK